MTIIVFLIDTNASMMQKTYLGTSHLDFARQAVEQFLKLRQRDPGSKGDRYMLMTFDEYPLNVKSGWKETQAIFTEQLKNLRVGSLCGFESAVESVLRFVNLNRMQSGIENYGYGRYPCYSEHVVIIAVTADESAEASSSTQTDGFTFTKQTVIGSELTTEPYRWDQRLFTLVLRLPGQVNAEDLPNVAELATAASGSSVAASPTTSAAPSKVFSADGPIDALSTAMGGRSFAIKSHRMLGSAIETIIQRIQQNGVTVKLQKYGSDPPPIITTEQPTSEVATDDKMDVVDDSSWDNQNVMLILKPNKQGQGHWPIPEAYSADSVSVSLPARMAHPTILFRCENTQPIINQDFPFDKYELSNTSLSQFILARQDPALCWQVYVENSSRIGGVGMPFGYLKPASNMQSVILFLMPYNYPALLPLLEEARNPVTSASSGFRQKMEKYLMTIPPYYYSPLRKAFKRIGLLVPFLEDSNPQVYSYSIVSLMTRIKHVGKEEFEAACNQVTKNLEAFPPALLNGPQFVKASHCRVTNPSKTALLETDLRPSLQTYLPSIPQIFKDVKICISDGSGTGVGLTPMFVPSTQFKNPFDIERRALINQLDKMRLNFDQLVETNSLHVLQGGMPGQKIKLQHAEDLHSQPISKMGDYQEYVRCLSSIGAGPLRELEPQAARPHAFGNPFKLDKKSIAVDEVGEMNTSPAVNSNGGNVESGGRGVRRTRSQSPSPICSAGGMASSFSSVPVAIRSKRKPGAIDPALLTSWKRRRRSSSVASDDSDAFLFTSETSSTSELEDLLQITDNNEAEYKIDDDSEDEDVNALTIFECNEESKDSSSAGSNGIPKNGFTSTPTILKSPKQENNQEHQENDINRNLFFDLNGWNNEDISAKMGVVSQMTASEICRKQIELSKAVRGIGDKYSVFNRCVNALKDVENIRERHFFLRFAMNEACRFKRNDLIQQIDTELKVLSSSEI